MKMAALLMSALSICMIGCGDAGTTTTSGTPGGGGGGGGISGPVGYITVNFPRSAPGTLAPVTLTLGAPLPTELGFRLAVSKIETTTVTGTTVDEDGNIFPFSFTQSVRTFFAANDNAVPGSLTLAVPVGTGYLIEVVSYDNDPSAPEHRLLRYGSVSNVAVTEGPNSITMNVDVITDNITLNPPAQINGGFPYAMTVSYDNVPLRNTFNFLDNSTNNFTFPGNIMDNAALTYTNGKPFTRTAPVGLQGGNIYFQGQFYLWDSMLSQSEIAARAWKKYKLNAPAPYNTDVSQQLFLPGTITITVI